MNVAGHAVYFEFVKSNMTTQVFLMPEGMTSAHAKVPMTLYRRRLSVVSPKKTWKQVASTTTNDALSARGIPEPDRAREVLAFMRPLLTGLVNNDWTLFKEPIIVEVTKEDLDDCRKGKTPYKALGRVWKVRKFLGFPKEYVHTLPGTSTI
jgi:hypothetical protein